MPNLCHIYPSSSASKEDCIYSEVFPATTADAGAIAFVLSTLQSSNAPVLWVQDRLSRQEAGLPYLPGLAGRHVIRADLSRPVDVLWAMEEGLRCKSLSAVVGEVWGDSRFVDFTATKRLAMRSEHYKVACWLIRRGASPDLSAARNRWRVASLPSRSNPDDSKAPGDPRWQVDLFRARSRQPGKWVATYDRTADRVDLSAPLSDGAVAKTDGAVRHGAAG